MYQQLMLPMIAKFNKVSTAGRCPALCPPELFFLVFLFTTLLPTKFILVKPFVIISKNKAQSSVSLTNQPSRQNTLLTLKCTNNATKSKDFFSESRTFATLPLVLTNWLLALRISFYSLLVLFTFNLPTTPSYCCWRWRIKLRR